METVYLTFHDTINLESANRFIDFCSKAIQQYKPNQLYFLLSSGGGDVNSGVTMYNYLIGLSQDIIMHNIGAIDSIANAVFLAGDKRYATTTSTFLLHGITWNFNQPTSLTYSQMQETISRFNTAEQLSAQIISNRSKLTAEEVRDLFRLGESKNPQFALEKEMIHEIRDVDIPKSSVLHSITAGGIK